MKALFISNDPNLFVEGSAVRARMKTYADAIGTLHVISRGHEKAVTTDGTLTLHSLPVSKVFGGRAFAAYAHEVIVKEGIEVVSSQDPFEYGRIAVKAVRGTGAKLHLQVHTDFLSPWFTRGSIFRSPVVAMPLKNAVRVRMASRTLPKANGIRVVSERIKESLLAKYGEKIPEPVVLPIAPSATVPKAEPFSFETLPFTLVTIGRLEPEKRIDDILTAISALRDSYPAIGLVIIGEGRERERLEKVIEELGLSSRVRMMGHARNAWALMQSAQAYIQASAYEGYGITLVEAALARVPIITSDVGVVGEVLKGIDDVLASPPGDPTSLAYHIRTLLEDPAGSAVRVRSAEIKAREHIAKYQPLAELIARDLQALLSVQ